MLIVDDEPEVHAVTKLALSDFHFNGRGLEFVSAYSGEEATVFNKHQDIAVVLLDVVMEHDDSGLQVAEYIRDNLNNHLPHHPGAQVNLGKRQKNTLSSITISTTINRRQNSQRRSFSL